MKYLLSLVTILFFSTGLYSENFPIKIKKELFPLAGMNASLDVKLGTPLPYNITGIEIVAPQRILRNYRVKSSSRHLPRYFIYLS
jgi:hypothetical protein